MLRLEQRLDDLAGVSQRDSGSREMETLHGGGTRWVEAQAMVRNASLEYGIQVEGTPSEQ